MLGLIAKLFKGKTAVNGLINPLPLSGIVKATAEVKAAVKSKDKVKIASMILKYLFYIIGAVILYALMTKGVISMIEVNEVIDHAKELPGL